MIIENCIIKYFHLLIFINPRQNLKGPLVLLLLGCLLVDFLKDNATELIKILHDDVVGLV